LGISVDEGVTEDVGLGEGTEVVDALGDGDGDGLGDSVTVGLGDATTGSNCLV
jgi:hypothetical protein